MVVGGGGGEGERAGEGVCMAGGTGEGRGGCVGGEAGAYGTHRRKEDGGSWANQHKWRRGTWVRSMHVAGSRVCTFHSALHEC